MTKTDRRVERTRELLQKALIQLLGERDYGGITIQDIVNRANVGRTTFYLHYSSKDELFMSCHHAIVSEFPLGSLHLHPRTREEFLSSEAPAGMISAYQQLKKAWGRLSPIFQSEDGPLILRRIRDQSAQSIERNLRAAFADCDSTIPLDVLANYLVGAQLALVQWWLEKRQPHSPEDIARVFYRLQRATICEAFGLGDGE